MAPVLFAVRRKGFIGSGLDSPALLLNMQSSSLLRAYDEHHPSYKGHIMPFVFHGKRFRRFLSVPLAVVACGSPYRHHFQSTSSAQNLGYALIHAANEQSNYIDHCNSLNSRKI
jgi:hypothetical protein